MTSQPTDTVRDTARDTAGDTARDARRDFDFLHGTWRIGHRRLSER
ncbi:MAG: hypothetical protein ACRDRJ_29590 [Streptosporangiaceae bacterium]